MLQGKIKKFKFPIDNNIENFIKDISIRKNEYIYACDAVDLDNINLNADSIINFFNFINESYSHLLLLLCQEGFDTVFNYIRISDNLNDLEQEKIFGCLTILIEKSVDVFKNYFKCLENCNINNESNNVDIMKNLLNSNNSIMNIIINCIEDNQKEYSVNEKKKKFTFFEINEILVSYFNALTFIYINIFNFYYNKNFSKQQNTEVVINIQRGRKKQKKDNEEETNVSLKNINCLLNNIILLLSNINFNIFYNHPNNSIIDLYLQFFLNIYIINQENNNIFNMSIYHEHISIIIGTLLKLYIKKKENTDFLLIHKKEENNSYNFMSHMEYLKDDYDNTNNNNNNNNKNNINDDNKNNNNNNNKNNINDDNKNNINDDNKNNINDDNKNNKNENFPNDKFYSFTFTYIFLNSCKKCANVNICDAILRVRNTDIPLIIIKELIDYIKENALLYLNLSVQTHLQNEIINVLNFLEYFSKNLSCHLLIYLKDLIDMLGIDIYYIRKSIFEIFKNFITLAKASEEIKETNRNSIDNNELDETFKNNFYEDEEDDDEENEDESDDEENYNFMDDEEEYSEEEEDSVNDCSILKKGIIKKKNSKNINNNNSKEKKKNKKKKNGRKNIKKKKKRMKTFLNSFYLNINEGGMNTYKDIINKIILDDTHFLQLCFKECLRNRAFIMNVLITRQYDSKLHVRCHLLKIFQELIENNFIPLNYYNNLCLICSERINDKSPLVRQRAFSLLSCIANDVVKNKYVIPLNTNKIKKELSNLNKRKNLLIKKEDKDKIRNEGKNCKSEYGKETKKDIKNDMRKNVKNKKRINLSDSDNETSSSSILVEKTNENNYQSKYDLLIKMYNEVLFISMIVDQCVDLCFKLLYSVIETDQKSSIKFIILAHLCGNKIAEEQMNKVWSLIFSNNNSIVEMIISEFVNVNIYWEDYRISAFRLINVALNSKLKDLSCIEKIIECLLLQEKTNVSISKLLDELFNIIFVDTFSENKNLMIKEGALILMKILCYSIHIVNLKKGKKEQYFIFSNKRKHLILLFINQYKHNLHFINLLILILRYNKTNKIIQNLLIILFNLIFDHIVDNKNKSEEENFFKQNSYNLLNNFKEYNSNNSQMKNKKYSDDYYYYLCDHRNIWFRCCQSIIESMYEHFDDFLVIFTTKLKNILNIICNKKQEENNKKHIDDTIRNNDDEPKIADNEIEENNFSMVSCFTLAKFIFVSGHLGLYTYIYAEKIQNKLKKIVSKSDNNYGMCTKEEKDREYFDYVVENMIVCNNLLGKKIMPLVFLILKNPENFFSEFIIKDDSLGNSCDSYMFFNSFNMKDKIYMHYEMYLLVLVCLLTLCKFSIISQKFCQMVINHHVSIIQLIVSIIIEDNNQIFNEVETVDDKNREIKKKSVKFINNLSNIMKAEDIQNSDENEEVTKKNGNYLCIENKDKLNNTTFEETDKNEKLKSSIMQKTISNIRKMLLISYADLLYRHPNLLEPYNKYIFKVLNDKDINMRRTAVSVFTHLFMTDTVKAKNTLLVHMMYLTIDEDEKISSGSKSFFYELDRKSHITLVNNICDMISVLANNERKLKYEMNKEILQFLMTFIKKSKYNETLVEKIFKKMKELNINKTDALHLYMQVFLNIQIDEKVLRKINKCFPLIRYIIRENQYILDNFVFICKKATEKKRGRPTEEVHQQSNATNGDKVAREKTENDKHENKMRELAEDILGKIESTTNKSKNFLNINNLSNSTKKRASKNKNEEDVNKNEEEINKDEEDIYKNEEDINKNEEEINKDEEDIYKNEEVNKSKE
ncbi:conserved Plasmodium protein, unknown function [Plasmodium gallinaceum]|uniref:Condensin complex subunit 1 C-terminal domain-containing protein n=1 Tax=Plasmodium gallinaceum TaxID=5849 RepID=A0A1J1GX02_PLAGA|nr:conserved Plasmodium protein, unknown function [Plasmodium gallinaceum]CRG95551.1 conserved Plasmodium protein, unknown function [Plasmodium gallinaceum]